MEIQPLQPKQPKLSTPKYIPIQTLIHYAEKGLTLDDIGRIVNVTKSAISQRFTKARYTPDRLREFRESKAEIYEYVQERLINSLTPSDLRRMAPDRRIWSIAVLEDKIRLIRGQSTANVSSWMHIVVNAKQQAAPQHVVFEHVENDDNNGIRNNRV